MDIFSIGGIVMESEKAHRREENFDNPIEKNDMFLERHPQLTSISAKHYNLLHEIALYEQTTIEQVIRYILDDYFNRNDLYLIDK